MSTSSSEASGTEAEPGATHQDMGEGDKASDREYREDLGKFLDREDPTRLAREAARQLDEEERSGNRTLRDAEKAGKSKAAEEDPEVSGEPRK